MEEVAMGQMTKEKAKLIHLKARKFLIEEQLDRLADSGSVDDFLACVRELDTVEHRIHVQENFLEEGIRTRVSDTYTVTSRIHPYTH